MLVLGINKAVTSYDKPLKDGGAALLSSNGLISAIAEERLAKTKGAGGYQAAVAHLLKSHNLSINDINLVVYSSCCENQPSIRLESPLSEFKNEIIPTHSHHFSHACSTYYTSGFDEALIIVIDSGGDVIENMQQGNNWWEYRREQHSYYVGRGSGISLVERDFDSPLVAGAGEIFRAFTKYLGWKTKYTGKLMSLAGLTHGHSYKRTPIFNLNNQGKVSSAFINDPLYPLEMISRFASENGVMFEKPRLHGEEILDGHVDMAHFVQSEYESMICKKISYLIKKYQIKNVCLAGGVALNCVANSKILNETEAEAIYIQPASGDQGQCLGNAIYGLVSKNSRIQISPFNPFLSPSQPVNESRLQSSSYFTEDLTFVNAKNIVKLIASLLHMNFVVGHFFGKSEFGPRALGHRSILASPMHWSIKERLNIMKRRESFNPFACSILSDEYANWFIGKTRQSPYMLLADKINPEKKHLIPAVVHHDGTSRVQTVTDENCPRFCSIISEFLKLTNIPLLLNTSLNGFNQPLAETVDDALLTFKQLELDCIVIDNFLIFKKSNRIISEHIENFTTE